MYLKRYLAITWLVPCKTAAISVHILCTPCNHAHVYSVTPCKATHIGCRCVFSCNLPPALWAEQLGSSICYCGNMGVEWILKEESAQKIDPGEENYPTAPQTPWHFHPDSGTLPVSSSLSPDRGWWNEPTDTYTSYIWASKGFVCDSRRSWQNQHQLTDAHIYHSYRWVRTSAVSDHRSRHLQCVELFTDSQINYTADGMNWLTNMVQLYAVYLVGRLSPSVTKLGEMGAAEAVMEWSCSLYWRNWRWSSNTSSSRRRFSPLVESNHRKCHKVQLPTLCSSLITMPSVYLVIPNKMHRVNLQNFNQIQHFHKLNVTESWHPHLTVVQSMYICNKQSVELNAILHTLLVTQENKNKNSCGV